MGEDQMRCTSSIQSRLSGDGFGPQRDQRQEVRESEGNAAQQGRPPVTPGTGHEYLQDPLEEDVNEETDDRLSSLCDDPSSDDSGWPSHHPVELTWAAVTCTGT